MAEHQNLSLLQHERAIEKCKTEAMKRFIDCERSFYGRHIDKSVCSTEHEYRFWKCNDMFAVNKDEKHTIQ